MLQVGPMTVGKQSTVDELISGRGGKTDASDGLLKGLADLSASVEKHS